MYATEDNCWEFSVERKLPLKRWHAYRVAVERIDEWWWHPRPISNILISIGDGGGGFRLTTIDPGVVQERVIFRARTGWFFYMTDAIRPDNRPGNPTMIGSWSFKSAIHGYSTHVATIRHFSEADYRKNLALGLVEGWNEAADKLVALCEEGVSAIKCRRN